MPWAKETLGKVAVISASTFQLTGEANKYFAKQSLGSGLGFAGEKVQDH